MKTNWGGARCASPFHQGGAVMSKLSRKLRGKGAVIALLLIFAAPLLSQSSNSGTAGVTPFGIPVTARQVGMGEASVAFADVNSFLYNPATLALLSRPYFTASHNKWLLDSYQSYVGYERPTKLGTFGVGVVYLNHGAIPVYRNGVPQGTAKPYDLGLVVGYGGRFHRYVALGANAKIIYSDYDGYTANALGVDFGLAVPDVIIAQKAALSFGLSVQNFGTQLKFIDKSYDQPLTIRGGLAVEVPNIGPVDINLALDGVKKIDSDLGVHAGGELWLFDILGIRGGYNTAAAVDEAKYSYGVSLVIRELRLDYAYVDYGNVSSPTHRLSVAVQLGKKDEIAGPIKVLLEDVKQLKQQHEQIMKEHEQMTKDITDVKMSLEEIRQLLKTNLKTYVTPDEILHLLTIHFEYGSSVVPNEEYPKILEAARLIKKYYPDKVITLEGHCDEAGSPELNMKLSLDRAESVKRILVEYGGIPEDQIVVVGKGETEPLTHRTGPGNYGVENRRVVFVVTNSAE